MQGIPYSFTLELPERDEAGDHGFLLPARNIVRVGRHLLEAFTVMGRTLNTSQA